MKLQDQKVSEITHWIEVLLFTSGPGGSESDISKEFFVLKQVEALNNIKDRMQKEDIEKANNQ